MFPSSVAVVAVCDKCNGASNALKRGDWLWAFIARVSLR